MSGGGHFTTPNKATIDRHSDAAQSKTATSLTASVALRNSILCVGALAMMFVTSPGLSAIAIGAIPLFRHEIPSANIHATLTVNVASVATIPRMLDFQMNRLYGTFYGRTLGIARL